MQVDFLKLFLCLKIDLSVLLVAPWIYGEISGPY